MLHLGCTAISVSIITGSYDKTGIHLIVRIICHSSRLECFQKLFYFVLAICSVLISKNDIVKISDFGTCREWNEKSTKMSFAGTVAWMAPEVIRNEPCSEKVDIW